VWVGGWEGGCHARLVASGCEGGCRDVRHSGWLWVCERGPMSDGGVMTLCDPVQCHCIGSHKVITHISPVRHPLTPTNPPKGQQP